LPRRSVGENLRSVKLFGDNIKIKALIKPKLDKMVNSLTNSGVENTFYEDKNY